MKNKYTKYEMKNTLFMKLMPATLLILLLLNPFYLYKNDIQSSYNIELLVILFAFIIIGQPIHELIHYLFLKKYGGKYECKICFLFFTVYIQSDKIECKFSKLQNSSIDEIGENIFSSIQIKRALIMPFIIISILSMLICFIINKVYLLPACIIINAMTSINDINELYILNKHKSKFIYLFKDIDLYNAASKKEKYKYIGYKVINSKEDIN